MDGVNTMPDRCWAATTYADAEALFLAGEVLVWCLDGARDRWCVSAAEAKLFFDRTPCGECHLQPGETCDICGRQAAAGKISEEMQ